jgi:hexulose-6-phosphate isomerase
MQGRLSKKDSGKIQSFPSKFWQQEFQIAKKLGIKFIEWTLDYKNFEKNPIFNITDIYRIKQLEKQNSVFVKSLTGDCFMQKPFWKKKNHGTLVLDLKKIISACNKVGIVYIVVPLVDNGSIKLLWQEKKLIKIFLSLKNLLKKNKVQVVFESDYSPLKLKKFIENFDKNIFGINYDSGNSAFFGYSIEEEFGLYKEYVKRIHIKDRLFKGPSVRLGRGNVNFPLLFKNIRVNKFKNSLVLQTARSKRNKDIKEIQKNIKYLNKWM